MRSHPIVKALLAEGYIVGFALAITYLAPLITIEPGPLVMIPAFLSTFVFSAACMCYFFISEPVLLAVAGKPKESVQYFLQTLLYFALVAAASVVLLATVSFYYLVH